MTEFQLSDKVIERLVSDYEGFISTEPIGMALEAMMETITNMEAVWIYNKLEKIRYEIENEPDFEQRDYRITDEMKSNADIHIQKPNSNFNDLSLRFQSPETEFVAGIRVFREAFNQFTFEVYTHDSISQISSVQSIEHLSVSDLKWIIQAFNYKINAEYSQDEDYMEAVRTNLLQVMNVKPFNVLMRGHKLTNKKTPSMLSEEYN